MSKPVNKNEIHTVTITDITHRGYGVCKINGFTVFIENTIPNEVVDIRIERVEKRFAFGKLLKILKASKDRVEVKDIIQTRLGTMPLQHLSYDAQLKFKKDLVIASLSKHVALDKVIIHDTLGMDDPYAYRNKAQIPVREINGVLETGFFKRGSHDLIPVENFQIQDKEIDKAILIVRDILREYNLRPYNEKNNTGLIRHIIVRKGHYTHELMLILVTNHHELPFKEEIVQKILEKLPNTVSIVHNINTQKTNVIMGQKQIVLFGEDKYYDKINDLTFAISSQSFYQVNSTQTEILYKKAIEYANITKDDIVVDAYCGIGSISLFAAQHARHVYGVEVVEDAIKMANFNKKLNNTQNVTFEVGKAETIMEKWVQEKLEVDVLIVDPPRKGLDKSFIESSLHTNPDRIVYVSCNPLTLGRDLKQYVNHNYEIKLIQPVDLFPHTPHIETIVLLRKNN